MAAAFSSLMRNATSSYGSFDFAALLEKLSRSSGVIAERVAHPSSASPSNRGFSASRDPDCITAAATSAPSFPVKKMLPRRCTSAFCAVYCPIASAAYDSPWTTCTKYNRTIQKRAVAIKKPHRMRARSVTLFLDAEDEADIQSRYSIPLPDTAH